MAKREGKHDDAHPIQLYGWDYSANATVKLAVNDSGELETS